MTLRRLAAHAAIVLFLITAPAQYANACDRANVITTQYWHTNPCQPYPHICSGDWYLAGEKTVYCDGSIDEWGDTDPSHAAYTDNVFGEHCQCDG
jgi:hypothetical protein